MRLIDADAFDKALSDAQDKCRRVGGNFRFGMLSTVRANLANAPTVSPDAPRVMTLDEACSDIDFCWLEIKDYQAVWVSDCVIMPNGRQVLIERLRCDPVAFKPEDYGKTWRCWENKPTDDQMKDVKWE